MGYKILLIHTRYKLSGGEDRVFENETQLLQHNGHETETLTFYNGFFSSFKFIFFPFNFWSFIKVFIKIKKYKPEIVHIHNFFFAASPATFYAIKACKIPIVVTTHNFRFICPSAVLSLKGKLYTVSLNKSFPWTAIKDKSYRDSYVASLWVSSIYWLHNKIGTWKLIDTLIIPNPYALKLYQEQSNLLLNKDIVCKPNYIDDPGINTIKRNNDFVYVGRLSEEKGIRMMLFAFAKSKQSLHIYGEGPMLEEVLDACNSNGNIHYGGVKRKDEVFEILRKCAAVILPSVCMEMTSLILIETLACGTPLIVSEIPTFIEYIESMQTGLVFKQGNANSLQEAITEFSNLTDSIRKTMGDNCRNLYLKHFTKENTYRILFDVYKSNIEKYKITS